MPHTVIADDLGGLLMQRGEVDAVIVGSDRTTACGDVCNKVGTYLKARAAHDNGVPFYAALPLNTIDWSLDDGRWFGRRRPSSKWRFHRDILAARADVGAVVHTHSPRATSLACTGRGIPAFHYMVAVAGGADIRCAPYHTFGTQALSDAALAFAGTELPPPSPE